MILTGFSLSFEKNNTQKKNHELKEKLIIEEENYENVQFVDFQVIRLLSLQIYVMFFLL